MSIFFMKFNLEDKVVFLSKRRSAKIWNVHGKTNWRPNHILLSKDDKGPLHPIHEDELRLATQQEIDLGKRNGDQK